jgi:hypothetical protein
MKSVLWRTPAAALAVGLIVAVAACDSGPAGPQSGNVRFVLSATSDQGFAGAEASEPDGSTPVAPDLAAGKKHRDEDSDDERPYRPFVSANVTFSSILARNFEGVLVDVAIELPTTVDIMRMEEGREVTLPDGVLPPGTYDQIVVVMTALQGELPDGTRITIEPPGGGWTAVVPICPFDIADGDTAVVGLKLSVGRSFSRRADQIVFDPRFECDDAEVTPIEG